MFKMITAGRKSQTDYFNTFKKLSSYLLVAHCNQALLVAENKITCNSLEMLGKTNDCHVIIGYSV